ncbi:MAG: hypothetical protein GY852_10945, partial [bacterium]|nr:hypothetical protein [bacterium]
YAAHDWFNEQAESPDLMKSRGLRPGEPLPAELGLFDNQGRPFPVQHRSNWEHLQKWLENDNAILQFFVPEGLSKQDRQLLETDLAILKKQPWSPQAAVKAILADWPENEPERPYSMENSEARLMEACDALIALFGL